MKKILLSSLFMALLLNVNLMAQSEKLVFVEEFTQASCPPCEATTPMLNAILEANHDKVIQLRYQTSWPGVDPMNADNPTEVATRVSYYGVNGVPDVFVDGAAPVGPAFPELVIQDNIDDAYSVDGAPVKIEVSHQLSDDLTMVDITVNIVNEGTEAYAAVAANRLRVATVEEVISWSTPPGSTSILDYEYVMKGFVTGTDGMEIPEIAAGDMWTNTWSVATPSTVYNFNEFAVVAFLQNDDDLSVVNAGRSDAVLQTNIPDLDVAGAGVGSTDFCDYSYTPSITVTNVGGGDATGFTASVSVNGTVEEEIVVTDALVSSDVTTVDFAELQLAPGANIISYAVVSANGDISAVNNNTPDESFGKASDGQDELMEGWEDEESLAAPSNSFVTNPFPSPINYVVISSNDLQVDDPIGGYAESDQALMINFWQWNPANTDPNGSIDILDRWFVEAEATQIPYLSFDYAFTTWGGSDDELIVEVSSDCGDTYTEVWAESGSDLATVPELNQNNQYFIPSDSSDWATVEIDMTDYVGETVMVRFRTVSAWGDQMYIDNINTRTEGPSSNKEIADVERFKVFPNPSSSTTNLSFNLTDSKEVTVNVYDQLGRTVLSQNLGVLSGNQNIPLNISTLTNGIYMLEATFDNEVLVSKLSVSK